MTLELTKPAAEYTGSERRELMDSLAKENLKRYAKNGRVTGAQQIAARREAWKTMSKAGF